MESSFLSDELQNTIKSPLELNRDATNIKDMDGMYLSSDWK